MFKKIAIICVFIVTANQSIASSCAQLTSYYASMKTYLTSCKQIGVMPGVFGEPNNNGTPITTATVSQCNGLQTANKIAAEMVISAPGTPGDVACFYPPAQLIATWSPFIPVLDNNSGFGLLNPCKDPDPRILLLNRMLFGTMCTTGF